MNTLNKVLAEINLILQFTTFTWDLVTWQQCLSKSCPTEICSDF